MGPPVPGVPVADAEQRQMHRRFQVDGDFAGRSGPGFGICHHGHRALNTRVVEQHVYFRALGGGPLEKTLALSGLGHVADQRAQARQALGRGLQPGRVAPSNKHRIARRVQAFGQGQTNARAAASKKNGLLREIHI